MNLGRTHLALGQSEQAAKVWQRALGMLEQQGREEEAGRLREQLQPRTPTAPPTADGR
ncbi:hypothetical protein SAMN04488564_102958 [Lentzea waywayandensis]|uniref:Uncharacterized protein n=2 Tax=Lentzea waywayandensis TaxID=84724 RepID=A0A1I6DL21_9PSEU|nr:hypothetical protein SAMN04488564_102958 [Lentzea waywayandensis]